MFDKLDAYNLVANLVPGAALTYALHFSEFPTPSPDNLGAFLLVSFVAGVTANRLGSLILDPLLRRSRFLKPKDYRSFLIRERDDQKLDALVANSGLYRTFFTAGALYLIAVLASAATTHFSKQELFTAFVIGGMVVFLFALRKEMVTSIVASRRLKTISPIPIGLEADRPLRVEYGRSANAQKSLMTLRFAHTRTAE